MRRTILLLLGFCLTALLPQAATAQDDDDHGYHGSGRQMRLSIGAGIFVGDTLDRGDSQLFEAGVALDDVVAAELRIGMLFSDWFELEGSVAFAPSHFVVDGDAGLFGGHGSVTLADVDVWHYTANTNFHFLPRNDFDPFVTIGAGAATYNIDTSGVDADTKFAALFGSGFNYWFGRSAGIRFDVRDYLTVIDVTNDYDYECGCYYDYDTSSNTLNNLTATVGLAVRWH